MVTNVLSMDSIVTGAHHAIDFTQSNETWIIAPGILAYSEDEVGVFGNNSNANYTLINNGHVYAPYPRETGVYLTSAGRGAVTNNAGAEIFGGLRGVFLDNTGLNIVNNFGTIVGASYLEDFVGPPNGVSAGVEFYHSTSGVLLNNHGYVFGDDYGVYDISQLTGGTINNFSVIRGGSNAAAADIGIYIDTAANLVTHVNNNAGGVISAGRFSIALALGQLHLVNHGVIDGTILDETTDPFLIVNPGTIHGPVALGGGKGIFNGAGGTSGPIFAGGGNDVIIAGNGNVKIHVGGGSDSITAGPGSDQFIFDSPLAGQVERITNFNPAADRIVLSQAFFPGIPGGLVGHVLPAADFHTGPAATTAIQHIIYDAANGFLFYDQDGKGGVPQVHFATLQPGLAMSHSDFLVIA
jgi:Ca2+-binding RTX toxin-like protein